MTTPYIHTTDVHNFSAPLEVVPLLMEAVKPASVFDVGCGTGTWLKVFSDHGVKDYMGADWHGLDPSKLEISKDKFVGADLRQAIDLKRKFDLVLSLEVAEHLPETSADAHIDSLIRHGDVILFSAAVPGQGGQNHENEQWPSWWQKKFAARGFYFHDTIRPLIWDNEKVDWWYRQNIFLVTRDKTGSVDNIRRVIHPAFLDAALNAGNRKISDIVEGRQGIIVGLRAFVNSVRFKLTSLFK